MLDWNWKTTLLLKGRIVVETVLGNCLDFPAKRVGEDWQTTR